MLPFLALGATFVVTSILALFMPSGILRTIGSGLDDAYFSAFTVWKNPFTTKSILEYADTFIALQADRLIPAVFPRATSVGRPYIVEQGQVYAKFIVDNLTGVNISAADVEVPHILNLTNSVYKVQNDKYFNVRPAAVQSALWTIWPTVAIMALIVACTLTIRKNRRLQVRLSQKESMDKSIVKAFNITSAKGSDILKRLQNFQQKMREREPTMIDTGSSLVSHIDFVISIIENADAAAERYKQALSSLQSTAVERDKAIAERDDALSGRQKAADEDLVAADQCCNKLGNELRSITGERDAAVARYETALANAKSAEEHRVLTEREQRLTQAKLDEAIKGLAASDRCCDKLRSQVRAATADRDASIGKQESTQGELDKANESLAASESRCRQLDSEIRSVTVERDASIADRNAALVDKETARNQLTSATSKHRQELDDCERARAEKDIKIATISTELESKASFCADLEAQNCHLKEQLRGVDARSSPSTADKKDVKVAPSTPCTELEDSLDEEDDNTGNDGSAPSSAGPGTINPIVSSNATFAHSADSSETSLARLQRKNLRRSEYRRVKRAAAKKQAAWPGPASSNANPTASKPTDDQQSSPVPKPTPAPPSVPSAPQGDNHGEHGGQASGASREGAASSAQTPAAPSTEGRQGSSALNQEPSTPTIPSPISSRPDGPRSGAVEPVSSDYHATSTGKPSEPTPKPFVQPPPPTPRHGGKHGGWGGHRGGRGGSHSDDKGRAGPEHNPPGRGGYNNPNSQKSRRVENNPRKAEHSQRKPEVEDKIAKWAREQEEAKKAKAEKDAADVAAYRAAKAAAAEGREPRDTSGIPPGFYSE